MTDDNMRVYGGRYEIQHKIARGGMADVFYARDNLLDRPVALKVLFPELSVDPSFVERFRREAQSAARLSHPNIVSVYDWGEDAKTYYIVMELVEGKSLSTILREEKRISVDRAAAIGSEVASALSFAHRNGVVHRDVKPGNVLIDGRGSVKVTDFGIARARNTTENLTQTGAVMGTATYFSPEQAQGLSVDQRSDVYSLGVVLYEMVAGRPPFAGDNPVTIAYKHVRETPEPLRSIDPSIAPDYQTIVGQALTKAQANRYQSADDLRNDLERFRRRQPITATGHTGAGPDETQAVPVVGGYRSPQQAYSDSTRTIPSAGPQQQRRQTPPPKKRNVAGPLVLFGALVALVALVVFLFVSGSLSNKTDNTPFALPDVKTKNVDVATKQLEDMKLNVSTRREASDTVAKDVVISQDPGATATVRPNQLVSLVVSSGRGDGTVPDVENKSEADARSAIQGAGFVFARTQAADLNVAKGQVISQNPSGTTKLARGESVNVVISTGKPTVDVPALQGFTQAAAERTLIDDKLQPSVSLEDSDEPAGTVIRTEPDAGTKVDQGSSVTIVVSTGDSSPTTTTSTTSPTTSNSGNGNGAGSGNG